MMRKYEKFLDEISEFSKIVKAKNSGQGVSVKVRKKRGVVITDAILTEDNILHRRAGKYCTINIENFSKSNYNNIIKILSGLVRKELVVAKKVLVVGMGNKGIISDALGPMVVDKIDNLKISESGKMKLIKIAPGVEANSGMDSFDFVKAIADKFKPDIIIAVDSLCSKDHKKLGLSFQFSDAGIVPGSASGNNNCTLVKEVFKVPVLAVGVPLVVYLGSVVIETLKNIKPLNHNDLKVLNEITNDSIYSPKDIDILVNICSKIIARAIEESII